MVSVEDFDGFSGIEGSVVINDIPVVDITYDVKWSWGDVTQPRAQHVSDVKEPGKFTVTTKITKQLIHEDAAVLLGYSLSETPITGTAGTLLATSHVLDAGDAYEDMTTPTIATPSRIRYTLATKAITVAGTISIIGEDANGNAIGEIIEVPISSIGAIFTSQKVYKKVYGHTIRAIDSTDDLGTFAVTSITGSSVFTVVRPKIFDLVGSVTRGTKTIIVTQPDCWFKEGGLVWDATGKLIEVNIPVEMHEPEALTLEVATA